MSANAWIVVRAATAQDLRDVVAIERVAFGDPWTRGMFAWHLQESSDDIFLIAHDGATAVLAFAIARVVGPECELFNIAVHPDSRGVGIGAMLLDTMMQRCFADGAEEMWLEVRASNEPAIGLYGSRGFAAVGRRKGYYNSPREDALVLRAELYNLLEKQLDRPPSCSRTIQRAGPGLTTELGASILSSASQQPRQETT